jgi:hypothetical protein
MQKCVVELLKLDLVDQKDDRGLYSTDPEVNAWLQPLNHHIASLFVNGKRRLVFERTEEGEQKRYKAWHERFSELRKIRGQLIRGHWFSEEFSSGSDSSRLLTFAPLARRGGDNLSKVIREFASESSQANILLPGIDDGCISPFHHEFISCHRIIGEHIGEPVEDIKDSLKWYPRKILDAALHVHENDIDVEECRARGVNSFSVKHRSTGLTEYVRVFHVQTPGKLFVGFKSRIVPKITERASREVEIFLNTVKQTEEYDIEAEKRALSLLKRLIETSKDVDDQEWNRYQIAGFIKYKSPRSGLTYYIRKMKPTLVFRERKVIDLGELGIIWRSGMKPESRGFLASICLHPAAYRTSSFAGLLVPTDDVVTHLTKILADEAGFWSEGEHHDVHDVEAGVI